MKTLIPRFGWIIMTILALGICIHAATYLNFDSSFGFLAQKESHIIGRFMYRVPFWTHVLGGIIALSVGPFQFLPGLRKKLTSIHRNLGKIYIVAILFAGISGIPVSLMAEGGWIARIGFLLLAFSWLYTTILAYSSIRHRKVAAHQQWMIRSYALTFTAVTLRIWLGILTEGLGWEFSVAYPTVAWISWVPNLMVAEWMIQSNIGELKLR